MATGGRVGDLVGQGLHGGLDRAPLLLGQARQAGAQAGQFGQAHGVQLLADGDDQRGDFQGAPPAQVLARRPSSTISRARAISAARA